MTGMAALLGFLASLTVSLVHDMQSDTPPIIPTTSDSFTVQF